MGRAHPGEDYRSLLPIAKPVMPLLSYIFPAWLVQLLAATIALLLVITLNEPFAAQSVRLPSEGERVTYHPSSHVRVVPDVVFARYGRRHSGQRLGGERRK
jgi:hypothetical protein